MSLNDVCPRCDDQGKYGIMGLCPRCGKLASGPEQSKQPEYVLYGYATPSGKLYASGMLAIANGEQSWVKVYVNKEDLK